MGKKYCTFFTMIATEQADDPRVVKRYRQNNAFPSRARSSKSYPARHFIAPFTLIHKGEKSHIPVISSLVHGGGAQTFSI